MCHLNVITAAPVMLDHVFGQLSISKIYFPFRESES